jgi:VanZ family protein
MRNRVFHFCTHTLPPFLWAGFIFYSSSLPDSSLPLPQAIPHSDKIAHAGAYGLLCLLAIRALRREFIAKFPTRSLLLAALLASLFGAFDEWHQQFVPTRTCAFSDWLADLIGTLLAGVGWIAWKRLSAADTLAETPNATE